MRLTPRLQAIAELIPPGSVIADIGTDHAYLPVYLLQEQICRRAVATDVKEAPLERARETVAAFNCHQKIDLRQGSGLQAIEFEDQVDTVVIAGLGGRTIAKILAEGRDKLNWLKRIIMQPINEAGYLRLFLAENGLAIIQERLVMENRHLYEIIVAQPGSEQEKDPFRLSLGPRLLENNPPLLPFLLQQKIKKLHTLKKSLQRAKNEDVSAKLQEVEKELTFLREVLANAAQSSDSD